MNQSARVYKIAGLFIALALPVVMALLKLKFSGNLIADAVVKECIIWGLFGLLLLSAKYREGEPIRFTTNNMSPWATVGLSLIIVLTFFVFSMFYGGIYMLIFKHHPAPEALTGKIKQYPMWLKLIIVIRAGIVEETFFRAYGMSRIKQLTNSNFLAFVIPLVFFAAGHYAYGTLNHVVGTFFIGAILAMYYLQKKNLVANIIGHSLFDLIALTAKSI